MITKADIVNAVQELFIEEQLYKPINNTLVTLIPKFDSAKTINHYRTISCCITIYKIISKIIRLGKVLNSNVNNSQAAFASNQHIQDHILLAYELIMGYSTKGVCLGACFKWTFRKHMILLSRVL